MTSVCGPARSSLSSALPKPPGPPPPGPPPPSSCDIFGIDLHKHTKKSSITTTIMNNSNNGAAIDDKNDESYDDDEGTTTSYFSMQCIESQNRKESIPNRFVKDVRGR